MNEDERRQFEQDKALLDTRKRPTPFDDPEWRERDKAAWFAHCWWAPRVAHIGAAGRGPKQPDSRADDSPDSEVR